MKGVRKMKNLGYYNGKFDELEKMTVPMNDRVHWFGDGVYDAGPCRNYHIFAIDEHGGSPAHGVAYGGNRFAKPLAGTRRVGWWRPAAHHVRWAAPPQPQPARLVPSA